MVAWRYSIDVVCLTTMNGAIKMSLSQQFKLEECRRQIEGCENPLELRRLLLEVTEAYFMLKAANDWLMRQTGYTFPAGEIPEEWRNLMNNQ